jgi:glycine betaine/proline transport system ATP-binding protein
VIGDDERLLGVVTDARLVEAANRRDLGLAGAIGHEYHSVSPDTLVGDFMHLAGRQVVPVTVVDREGRLSGVVPRATILSALSHVREVSHA